MDERIVPLMGVMGAFVFAAQMINFTIPGTGSSGHLAGGLLLAAVLGPWAAFIAIASVLTVQALFFADGGLLALGCNIWNIGFYSAFLAYPLIYRPIAGDKPTRRRVIMASLAGAVAALQMGAFSVVIETLLSGRSELPPGPFLLFMQPIHLAIGIVEGLVTAGVVLYVRSMRPEALEGSPDRNPVSVKKLIAVFLVLAVITGGALSWLASSNPDGLEWSLEKVYSVAGLPQEDQGVHSTLGDVQQRTALMPDYGFRGQEGEDAGLTAQAGKTASGIMGSAFVLMLILFIGIGIRALRTRKA